MPEVESHIQGGISWRGLAGYSLAGLFAFYALYQTELFARIASISGSLWVPGILPYTQQNQFAGIPNRIYLSLGDKEAESTNPYLSVVRENTEQIHIFLCRRGINTTLQLNPGGHHDHAAERTAKAIAWLLEESIPCFV